MFFMFSIFNLSVIRVNFIEEPPCSCAWGEMNPDAKLSMSKPIPIYFLVSLVVLELVIVGDMRVDLYRLP